MINIGPQRRPSIFVVPSRPSGALLFSLRLTTRFGSSYSPTFLVFPPLCSPFSPSLHSDLHTLSLTQRASTLFPVPRPNLVFNVVSFFVFLYFHRPWAEILFGGGGGNVRSCLRASPPFLLSSPFTPPPLAASFP